MNHATSQETRALALLAASGFAGLGLQIVWTQQGALWLGHEAAAVLAVVAAFFGGLALGAALLGGRIERSARPGRWLAGCEATVGAWSLLLAVAMPQASAALQQAIGAEAGPSRHWAIAFGGCFLLLLPATAAMGATLPAMERALRGLVGAPAPGRLAALYAANTAGALLGVLAAALWLVPQLGLLRTAALCAGLNAACAIGAWWLFHRAALPPEQRQSTPPDAAPLAPLARLFATGALAIGYEVLVVRVLAQLAEDTVYTFALLLAVYLVGTALGAAAFRRWRRRAPDVTAVALRDRLLLALATACLLGSASLWGADRVKAAVLSAAGALPTFATALGAEALLAALAFGLPTLVMGALFSHLCEEARLAGRPLGSALAVNTLGAALAPLVFGVVLLPAAGAKAALLAVAAGYALLASRVAWSRPPAWGFGLAMLALALAAPRLAFVDLPEGARLVDYREGATAAVSVVEDAAGVRRLFIDNRQAEGSSATVYADARQALLPLLLHPAPRRALFLGLGTGITAGAAAEDGGLERVDAVELLPEVIAASAHFADALDADASARARLQVRPGDARRYVRSASTRYDVIVADNVHPARSGAGSLYTVEHFAAVRERLAPGGLFCQWLPLHQLDLATLRSIVASFLAVHPHGALALLATYSLETPVLGLIAQAAPAHGLDPAVLRERLARAQLPRPPAAWGLPDELALLGSVVAGESALARFAAGAPLNTDDRPVVAYAAPRITYVPDSLPRERLLALLGELDVAPGEGLAAGSGGAAFEARLDAYRAARDRFLAAGRDVRPSNDVHTMLAQVREPLLAALHESPEFRPAREPLLRMAEALARNGEATAARELLRALPQELAR